MMCLLVIYSILDFLALLPVEFFMILVSCPVKTTTPYIQSVFLKEDPLSKKLSYESDYLLLFIMSTPSN
jgi:hypothetical protein